ncbi:MAG: hypothetical protein ACE5FK_03740 [Candidatus Methylomirabilia bacterium]
MLEVQEIDTFYGLSHVLHGVSLRVKAVKGWRSWIPRLTDRT